MKERSPATIVDTRKAVVFDLFHTLVSLRSAWGDKLPRVHEILGVSGEAWRKQLERKLHELYTDGKTDAFSATAEMARAIDPTISNRTIESAVQSIVETFAGALMRVPAESIEVLTLLKAKGKRIGLVSNASVMEVTAWDRSPLAPFFDSVIFSCYAGCVKPDPKIYEMCLGDLGVVPAECVFVGDGGSEELEGARDLGMTAIMIAGFIREVFPRMIEERRKHADFMIEHLDELLRDCTGLQA
jgi:putative hydrolase of the HAD superfamily